MSLHYIEGDLLEATAEALVNPVNCVGVMGRGLALNFKRRYPDNFTAYRLVCRAFEMRPGEVLAFETNQATPPYYIINFPTKRHWQDKSRLEDIILGLKDLEQIIETRKMQSVALPQLGCGLGRLSWNVVKPYIEQMANNLPHVNIMVYALPIPKR